MFVCCECCVLSGRDLCDGLITRPGESYRLWCVVECDQETSYARRLQPDRGLQNTKPQWVVAPVKKWIRKNVAFCGDVTDIKLPTCFLVQDISNRCE
jgi:hypothetical protein